MTFSEDNPLLHSTPEDAGRRPRHTPGPWRVGNVDRTTPTVLSGGRLIAEVHDLCIPSEHADDVANAHLIAAAPDLLEACLHALSTVKRWDKTGIPQPTLLRSLRDAIAKAEGGAA